MDNTQALTPTQPANGAAAGELVEVRTEDGQIERWKRQLAAINTNVKADTEVAAINLMALTSPQDIDLKLMVKKTLLVRAIAVHDVERLNPLTGKMEPGVRTAFLLEDGTVVSGSGDAVAKMGLFMIAAVSESFFDPPWPVEVMMPTSRVGLNAGKQYCAIRPLERGKEPKPGKAK